MKRRSMHGVGWEKGDGAQGAGGAEDEDMAPSSDQTANVSLPPKPQRTADCASLPL